MYSLIEAALLCANLKQILQFCNDKMKVNIIENLAQCALTGEKVKAQTRTHIHRHRHRHTKQSACVLALSSIFRPSICLSLTQTLVRSSNISLQIFDDPRGHSPARISPYCKFIAKTLNLTYQMVRPQSRCSATPPSGRFILFSPR